MKLTREQHDKLLAYQERIRQNKAELESLPNAKPISSSNPDGDYIDGISLHLRDLTRFTDLQITLILQNCEILDLNESDTIQVGSQANISISCNGEMKNKTVTIVEQLVPGMVQSDNLSINSPLGKALLNRHEGETFTFIQPNSQEVEVTICEIIKYNKERQK